MPRTVTTATDPGPPVEAPPPLSPEAFRAALQGKGTQYYDTHPFHRRMHAGTLTREEIESWVANRFYYQKMIPIKDAALISNCPERETRRVWLQRIIDHDGRGDDPGGIERWLRLGEAVGLDRETLEDDRRVLPGVRFAVDAYVNFVRQRHWLEGVASSLTELFAPGLLSKRLERLEKHYPWIDASGLQYFRERLSQAPRDAGFALDLVVERCLTRDQQARALAALTFKCDVLWALLDAIDSGDRRRE